MAARPADSAFKGYFRDELQYKAPLACWLAFGVAQVTKFSTPLLLPLFLFVLLVLWVRTMVLEWSTAERTRRFKKFFMIGWRYLRNFILIVVIGYVFIVYPIYFLFTVHYPIAKQVSDTQALLTSFANGPTATGQFCKGIRCLADVDIWAAKNPIMRPYAEYLLGLLMVLQRADGGNTIYFLGHVVQSGGWTYFPTLYLLKEPIPSLIIVIAALLLALWMALKPIPKLVMKKCSAAFGSIFGYETRFPSREVDTSLDGTSRLSPENISRNATGPASGWSFRAKNARFRVLKPIWDYIGLNLPEFTMGSFIMLYWGYSMHSQLNIASDISFPRSPSFISSRRVSGKNGSQGFVRRPS